MHMLSLSPIIFCLALEKPWAVEYFGPPPWLLHSSSYTFLSDLSVSWSEECILPCRVFQVLWGYKRSTGQGKDFTLLPSPARG